MVTPSVGNAESWRLVPNTDGRYEVSSEGRVRSWVRPGSKSNSVRRGVPYILAPTLSGRRTDLRRTVTIDRLPKKVATLVALAFLGPRPDECEVNHKDGNKLNDSLANLEWTTRIENMRHAFRMGLVSRPRGERSGRAKLTEPQVRHILSSTMSGRAIAAECGVSEETVYAIRSRRIWRHVPAPRVDVTVTKADSGVEA